MKFRFLKNTVEHLFQLNVCIITILNNDSISISTKTNIVECDDDGLLYILNQSNSTFANKVQFNCIPRARDQTAKYPIIYIFSFPNTKSNNSQCNNACTVDFANQACLEMTSQC